MKTNNEKAICYANERMERLRRAKEQLAEEVSQLMGHSSEENLKWTASAIDLMEALYYAFQEQTMTDDYGVPLSFRHIVNRCCQVLHVKVPRNPYESANRGRMRKGVKCMNYLKRYMLLMETGKENVLWKGVSTALA